MRINIFEGARRIAKLTAALGVVGVGAYAFSLKMPPVTLYFEITWPDEAPKPIDGPCDVFDRKQTRHFRSASGVPVVAEYCFRAQTTSNGALTIPTNLGADKTWQGAYASSPAVSTYAVVAANRFVLTPADEVRADQDSFEEMKDSWQTAATTLAAGLFALWLLTKTIGWIVRGFAGIPGGQDHRPADLSPKA